VPSQHAHVRRVRHRVQATPIGTWASFTPPTTSIFREEITLRADPDVTIQDETKVYTMRVRNVDGDFVARWFDPRTGLWQGGIEISAGVPGDWVLLLRRRMD